MGLMYCLNSVVMSSLEWLYVVCPCRIFRLLGIGVDDICVLSECHASIYCNSKDLCSRGGWNGGVVQGDTGINRVFFVVRGYKCE